MKSYPAWLIVLLCFSLLSFRGNSACGFAGSNLGLIKSQVVKALGADGIDKSRFFAYKALNAMEKSKNQLNSCGCDYAINRIDKGKEVLKRAIKSNDMSETKSLLRLVVEHMEGSLDAVHEHHSHKEHYSEDILSLNTNDSEIHLPEIEKKDLIQLEQKIDQSLLKFQQSLEKVVNSLDCERAYAYTHGVYENSEKELLNPEISEGTKIYHLKTQQIAAAALRKLGKCDK